MLIKSTFQLLQVSSINVNIGNDLPLQRNTSCPSIFEAFLLLKLYFIIEILCSHDPQNPSLTRLERLKGKSASETVGSLPVSLNGAGDSENHRQFPGATEFGSKWSSSYGLGTGLLSQEPHYDQSRLVCSPWSHRGTDKSWEQYALLSMLTRFRNDLGCKDRL